MPFFTFFLLSISYTPLTSLFLCPFLLMNNVGTSTTPELHHSLLLLYHFSVFLNQTKMLPFRQEWNRRPSRYERRRRETRRSRSPVTKSVRRSPKTVTEVTTTVAVPGVGTGKRQKDRRYFTNQAKSSTRRWQSSGA